MKLSEAIKLVPAKFFPKVDGEKQPDYKGIFAEVVTTIFDARGVKYHRDTVEKIAEHINLSSYQRAAALECERRYGKMDKHGVRVLEEKPAKVKAPPVKGKRGVDPISGEKKVKKAAAPKVEKVPEKPKKAATPKVEKEAPKKATQKAKKPARVKLDPISGEPMQVSAK